VDKYFLITITFYKEAQMKFFFCSLIVLFFITQLGCNKPESFDSAQVQKSIEEACAKYSEAIREANVADVADVYTVDATIIPPDGEIVRGKSAIEEFYKKLFQIGMKEGVLTTIEVGGSGDTAYEIGKSKVLIQPEGQAAIQDSTRYLVIWKHQADGTWKVHVDIWNMSCR
jgi:uncharacterized protein (TIGR02246 family)